MSKLAFYFKSMRVRTLPLSLSGVSLGILLACSDYTVRLGVAIWIIVTTICLQILSNISNELGDMLSGVDDGERQGPQYSLSEGGLSIREMKRFIAVMVVLCILSGLAMIYASYGTLFGLEPICLVLLGGAAISGAIKYTLGANPYGYKGLGDLFVFIFFGLVAVLGSYFVAAHTIPSWLMALPSCAMGFFSMGVLNVNNIRDMDTDAGKRLTIPLRIGLRWARVYHTALVAGGWACLTVYNLMRFQDPWHYLFYLTLPLFALHLRGVWTRTGRALDPMLPMLALSTFALSLLMGLGYVAFLL